MDPKELRESLGLPEDATDEEVKAKLEQARGESGEGSEQPDPDEEGQEGTPEGDEPEEEPAAEAEPIAASGDDKVVSLDKKRFEQLERDASLGVTARRAQLESQADGLVKAAVDDGRIAPASKAAWREAILPEKASELVKSEVETLDKLAAGRIPVDERGTAPNAEGTDDATHAAIMASFGVERKVS